MVERIVEITREERVTAVIIAGDLFDRAIPPAEAIDLFDHALSNLRATGATVVAISGNHDSPIRVSAHDRILAEAGVIIRGSIGRAHEPAVINGGDGGPPVAIYAIPYLEPSIAAPILGRIDLEQIDLDTIDLAKTEPEHPGSVDSEQAPTARATDKRLLADQLAAERHSAAPTQTPGLSTPTLFDALLEAESESAAQPAAGNAHESCSPVQSQPATPASAASGGGAPRRRAGHHDVTASVTKKARADLSSRGKLRSIVVSHTFLTGGEKRDSERELSMGNVDTVGINAFADFDYVALGHLHGRQSFDGGRVSYSGSPLPYSFSEERDVKSVNLVDLDAQGGVAVERIPLDVGRALKTIEGELDQLLARPEFAVAEHARVRARLTDRRLPAQAMARLRPRFPHAVELRHVPPTEIHSDAATAMADRRASDPVSMAQRFLAEIHHMSLDDIDQELLRDAFSAANEPLGTEILLGETAS